MELEEARPASVAERQVRALDLLVIVLALLGTNGVDAGLPLLALLALVVACRWVFTWRPEVTGVWRDGARVVGAWALPLLLPLLARGFRSPRLPFDGATVFLAGVVAAVVAGAALTSGDGRRRWAVAPLVLTLPLVLAANPWGTERELFALGAFAVLLATATTATVLQAVDRWLERRAPRAPAAPPTSEATPRARSVGRTALGIASLKAVGVGVGLLAFLVARPLQAREVRPLPTALALTLGAWAWALVAWAQAAYAQELLASGSFDRAYEAARLALATPGVLSFVPLSALGATLVAVLAAPSSRHRVGTGVVATVVGGVAVALERTVYTPLVLDGSAQVQLFVETLPLMLLACGLWALLGVAVGDASDRVVDAVLGQARGSDRAEPEPNPGPGGPDVAPPR